MTKRLVIVESPTKAKTLKKFLGKDYVVKSSLGHIRDLPASAAEIPAEMKKEAWSRLGVNTEDDFEPLYVISPEKRQVIQVLKDELKKADELLLATDEDREGEAISWHLREVLKPKIPMRRMVFHEITRKAIQDAVESTRDIDDHMVEAYRARRIIDRLYGYEVSPILWRKVAPRLSAGRVQSVAIRMLVEREEERMRFKSARYWDLTAEFMTSDGSTFPARLVTIDGKRIAEGKDFDPTSGLLANKETVHVSESDAAQLAEALARAEFSILSTEEKPFTQYPAPPFTTSTLQQEGGRKLRFDARRTMRAAQRLYELGYITYMRTDSVALSPEAINAARTAVSTLYGDEYLPDAPIAYKTRVRNAQEAHEAIRPASASFPTPAEIAGDLGGDEQRIYDLVWKRTLACQMKRAEGRRMIIRIGARVAGKEVVFQANGRVIDFAGFLRAYVEGSDDPEAELQERDQILPAVREKERVEGRDLRAEVHETQPPARLTEASLVKALEESGIGRPSTYASIIGTIEQRSYTFKKGSALVPTFVAFAVVRLLREHFTHLVDYDFTAKMEDRLDEIARGEDTALPYLKQFYFGNGTIGLKSLLKKKEKDIDPRQVCSISIGKSDAGDDVVVRVGRFGPFLQLNDITAPVPDELCPDEITLAKALALIEAGKEGPQVLGQHPESNEPIYVKVGRYGPYVQLGDPKEGGKKSKPKMVSLTSGITVDNITLADAVRLLTLPRTLGKDVNGVDVVAHLGRYGPYIKRGDDTRSLRPPDNVLTIELPRALEVLAEERVRGRGSATPVKVFEKVAALEGLDIKLYVGRYGPYASDGTTNAALPKGRAPESLTVEEIVQLILERRSAPPSKRRGARGRRGGGQRGGKAAKAAAVETAPVSASGSASGSEAEAEEDSSAGAVRAKRRPAGKKSAAAKSKPAAVSSTKKVVVKSAGPKGKKPAPKQAKPTAAKKPATRKR